MARLAAREVLEGKAWEAARARGHSTAGYWQFIDMDEDGGPLGYGIPRVRLDRSPTGAGLGNRCAEGGKGFDTEDVGGKGFETEDVGGKGFETEDVGGRSIETEDVGGRSF